MAWTEITRAQYLRDELRYASDMTDAEWRLIARRLPSRRRLGRPRKVDLRNVVEAILYVLSTGCQWKAMPREFGSGSAIHEYFQEWVRSGIFAKLWRCALEEYEALKGIDWEWQSLDGAMTKSPLGGEKNRQKPDRSWQARRETLDADRWPRRASGSRRGRRQCA